MLRPLMKPEAKFLSYWSRILFLLFAVRGHQFCIMQDNIKKINYHLKVWPCTSAKLIGLQFRQMVSNIQECTICTKSSIFYQKMAVKAGNLYQRWPWRNSTWISVWNILLGETGLDYLLRCWSIVCTDATLPKK